MCGAKRVVDIDVAQGSHLARQCFVVLFLAWVDAAVLQHHHLTGRNRHAIDPIGQHWHVASKQFAQAFGHGGQGIFGFECAFGGAAQMAGHHDRSTCSQGHFDAGHGGADARVLADATVVIERDVQVGADEHAFAFGGALGTEVCEAMDVHVVCLRGVFLADSRGARGGPAAHQPQAMCSGKYTAMPTTMVPSTACPWPRRQK